MPVEESVEESRFVKTLIEQQSKNNPNKCEGTDFIPADLWRMWRITLQCGHVDGICKEYYENAHKLLSQE